MGLFYKTAGWLADLALILNIFLLMGVLVSFGSVLTLPGIAGIVLTGGGAMMKHIRQLAEFKTGMEVRLGNPNESLAKDKEELSCPMYSTGIGLVLEGFAKYENDINRVASLNKEIKKETVSQVQENDTEKELPDVVRSACFCTKLGAILRSCI